MDTPAKRVLTDESRASQAATDAPSPSSCLSPDLAACLANIARRVRKSVTEGYTTDQLLPGPSRTSSVPPGELFRASQDTFRDVYGDPSRRPLFSPRKRQRRSADDLADEEDADASMQLDSVQEVPNQPGTGAVRPMRPLRRTRKLGATQSSPAVLSGNTGGEATNQMVEEDWSVLTTSRRVEQFSYDPMAM